MIQLDGFYPYKKGTVIEKEGDVLITHPISDKYAKDIVSTNNANVQAYADEFASHVMNEDNLDFGEWVKYNTGLMPYVRKAAETEQLLRIDGYDYKVNMQSGMIVE